MARPQEFNRAEVLYAAAELFRKQGYNATSVTEIVNVTGLQPGSIYGAFGNKKGLLIDALITYCDQQIAYIESIFSQFHTPMAGIYAFLRAAAKTSVSDSGRYGCLMLNTLLELSSQDDEISELLNTLIEKIEQKLFTQLQLAQAQGELKETQSAELLAKFILRNVWGLHILGKTNADATTMSQSMGHLSSLLESCTIQNEC